MPEHGETVVKLFFETREEAEKAATDMVAQGLEAETGRPAMGAYWSVMVTGPDELVERLGERLLRELETDE